MPMTPADREAIIAVIEATVTRVVNGKIDRLTTMVDHHNEKHEEDMKDVREHIEATKPILEAYQGTKMLGSLVKWIAGVGAAVLLIYSWLIPKI